MRSGGLFAKRICQHQSIAVSRLYCVKNRKMPRYDFKKRKSYYRTLQKIIEFYMSDANLRHDSHLKVQMNEYLEVKSAAFLEFHQVAELKASVHDIFIALRPSRFLEATNHSVQRRFPIQEKSKEDVDKCSIYVERLQNQVTHEYLTKIFSKFGKVNYVTIPRYRSNKKVKGYAFIEFEDESSCAAALDKFADFGGVMGEDYSACIKFSGNNDASHKAKKIRLTEPSEELDTSISDNPETDSQDEGFSINEKRKKKRLRKNRVKGNNYGTCGLQIMSKDAWNQLRHRYLCIQAANRRILKAQLAKLKKKPVVRPKVLSMNIARTLLTVAYPAPITKLDVKTLKLADFIHYVDYKPGSHCGIIRMSCRESAIWFVMHAKHYFPHIKVAHMALEDECAYMRKILRDRAEMKSRKRLSNISGVQKIIKRAQKHSLA